ncbi:hypothetical protein [cyanobacterium endosymbiont of Epithemia turgida]|uniref:hypothetical protein n=1 Tax=cyanobacterium endosymbiont of Epithemia turgida TaxID=718217 RepID=UPI0004D12184|nr:hypothetical protein [cyanobacterium endosymbiont of Epithemia turgida]BAP18602.1 hypothetical protein ETSB_1916 [cyanobacterium endosymbiont of Epithemia turgida isolate EtSB Lake Yunoko]
MAQPMIYLAETGHVFGYTVRLSSLDAAIQTLNPSFLLMVVTTVPRYLLKSYITKDFI